ncbi:TPA: tape measure protein [Citrobacter amalonaticus]|nr:tail tape measure protein [Citrobacter amalonaticus]HAZ4787845.1 tape measure protein [Citrobacter amalonaticus]
MASNVIVTSTVNEIKFKIDNKGYQAALKKIQSLKTAWTASSSAALKASKQYEQAGRTFRKSQEWSQRAYNPAERKAQAERLKQQRAEMAIARRTNQIRAAGVRFNTKNTSYNLTSAQRAQAISDFSSLSKAYHSGSLALGEYNARLAQLHQRMRNVGGLARKPVVMPVRAKITSIDTSMVQAGIAGLAAYGMGRSVMDTGQQFEAAQNGLTAVMGSAQAAAKEFDYLRGESNRLGLDLIQTAKDYTRFAASANGKIDNSQIHNLFEGVSEYGRVVGATSEEQSRSIRALQQMLSKGTIQSEELKGQLAEGIPGAVGIFTKALNTMKGTTDLTDADLFKLMEDGKLFAKDILPYVADEMKKTARSGGALDKAIKSNAASMARMKTAFQNSMNTIFQSSFGEELTTTFDKITAALNNNQGAFELFGDIAGGVLDGFTSAVEMVYNSFVLLKAMLQAEFPGLTKMFEGMGHTVGQVAGYAIFTAAVFKLGGALKFLVGFANPLKGLLTTLTAINALGGVGGMTTPGTDNKKGKNKGNTKTTPTKGGKGGGFSIGLPAIMAFMSVNSRFDEIQADPDAFKREVDANNNRPTVWTDIMNAFRQRSVQSQQNNPGGPDWLTKPTDKTGWSPSYAQPMIAPLPAQAPAPAALPAWANIPLRGEAEVTIKPIELNINDGAVKGLVTQAIDDYEAQQVNLFMGVPE